MDPGQTAPDLGLHCLSKRLIKNFSRWQKQRVFVVIGAYFFKVSLCDFACFSVACRFFCPFLSSSESKVSFCDRFLSQCPS